MMRRVVVLAIALMLGLRLSSELIVTPAELYSIAPVGGGQ